MRVRFTNIQWDTDDEVVEIEHLPRETIFDVDDDFQYELEDHAADLLSDYFGWCVLGCSFEILA